MQQCLENPWKTFGQNPYELSIIRIMSAEWEWVRELFAHLQISGDDGCCTLAPCPDHVSNRNRHHNWNLDPISDLKSINLTVTLFLTLTWTQNLTLTLKLQQTTDAEPQNTHTICTCRSLLESKTVTNQVPASVSVKQDQVRKLRKDSNAQKARGN